MWKAEVLRGGWGQVWGQLPQRRAFARCSRLFSPLSQVDTRPRLNAAQTRYLPVLESGSSSSCHEAETEVSAGPVPAGGSRKEPVSFPFPPSRGPRPLAHGHVPAASAPIIPAPLTTLLPPSREAILMTLGPAG